MPTRPQVKAALCAVCLVAGFFLARAYLDLAAHILWGSAFLALGIFLWDGPVLPTGTRWGTHGTGAAASNHDATQDERERAARAWAVRDYESRVRERERDLERRSLELLRRENDLQREWARLESARRRVESIESPEVGSVRVVRMAAHEWLGVPLGANEEEARKAWTRLVQVYHPDKVQHLPSWARQDAQRRTQALNEAYAAFRRR